MREYGVFLHKALRDNTFSWRLFHTLVKGLSGEATFNTMLYKEKHPNGEDGEEVTVFDGSQEEDITLFLKGVGAVKQDKRRG